MKLLLDTHTFIWSLLAPERLSEVARNSLTHPENQVLVSAVSFWEISLKAGLGKLTLQGTTPEALVDVAQRQGFELLPLEPRLAASFSALPQVPDHRDPFDRMLIWQAISLGLTLVSRDRKINENDLPGLRVIW